MIKNVLLKNQDEILLILGVQDRKLQALEKNFKVVVFVKHEDSSNGAILSIKGTNSRVDKTVAFIQKELAAQNRDISADSQKQKPISNGTIFSPNHGKPIVARNEHQLRYVQSIFEHDIVISTGPAGTGKTFLACACALRALELGLVEKIIVTRPIVEAGEKLGFLPGTLEEKVDPYLRPIYDAFFCMLGTEKFNALKYNSTLEIVPLAYMRGRTLEKSFIILDEAQNTLNNQIKMFLTRMGIGSKMIINGDLSQIDLPLQKDSGLIHAKKVLADIEDIAFIDFTGEDIVRHPLVKEIIQAYEDWNKKNKELKK